MKTNPITPTIEFQKFIKSCRNYCDLLEIKDETDSIYYLVQLQKALLKLYSNGLNLKSVDLKSNKNFEKKLNNIEFELIKKQIGKLLGEHQYYWTIFDPTENIFGNESPVLGDLLDDILDIYRDIKSQLMIFDLNTNESIESAVWGMKFYFWQHWSNHGIDAMRTIHYVIEKIKKYE
jgi:hypothetical protein